MQSSTPVSTSMMTGMRSSDTRRGVSGVHRVADELLYGGAARASRATLRSSAPSLDARRLGIETLPHPVRTNDVRKRDDDDLPHHAPSLRSMPFRSNRSDRKKP